jgi:hypothetical protein
MAEANHSLHPALSRDHYILARYKALQLVRQRYRSAGIKPLSIKLAQQLIDAEALIHEPEVVAWAQDVAQTKLCDQGKKPRKSRASAV